MLKRILIKVLARDFCAGSSSFTQRSASFVPPTVQDIAEGALLQNLCQSASGVLYQWWGRWRKAKAALQRSLVAGEGCPGEQMSLHTEQCWSRMVGQSRQGRIGNIPARKCLSLFSYIHYTENRACIFYWKRSHLPTHSLALSFLLVSFRPQKMNNPMKKTVTLPWNLLLSLYPTLTQSSSQKGEKEYLWNGLIATLFLNINTAGKRSVMHKASTGASFNLCFLFSDIPCMTLESVLQSMSKNWRRCTKKGSKNHLRSRDSDLR